MDFIGCENRCTCVIQLASSFTLMKRKANETIPMRRHSSILTKPSLNPKPVVSAGCVFPIRNRRHSIGSQYELKGSPAEDLSDAWIGDHIGQALSDAAARRAPLTLTQGPTKAEQEYRVRLNDNLASFAQGSSCLPILEGDDFSDSTTATDTDETADLHQRMRNSSSSEDVGSSTKSSLLPGYRIPVWRTSPVPYERFKPLYPQLHEEIEEYAAYTQSIVKQMAVQIERTIDSVRECVRILWPNASVETFGSYSTGLWLPNSDVDLVVLGVEREESSVLCLHKVAAMLEEEDWVHSILVLETAKVPVIKVVSSGTAVPIDITFESTSTHSGLLARDLVVDFCKNMPEVYPLVIILKQLLRERKLNEAYTGGLSSYSAVLMTVHFLQLWSAGPEAFEDAAIYASGSNPTGSRRSSTNEGDQNRMGSYVSNSKAAEATDINQLASTLDAVTISKGRGGLDKKSTSETVSEASTDSEMGDDMIHSCGEANLGLLLVSLLEFFGVIFNYKTSGISVRDGGFIYRVRNEANGTPPVLEDPIYPSHNVGCSSFAMKKVVACFEDAYYSLKYFRRTRFSPTALSLLVSHVGHDESRKRIPDC